HISDCSTPSDSFVTGSTVCAKATGLGGSATGTIDWLAPGNPVPVRSTSFGPVSGNVEDTFAPVACGTWTLKLYVPAGSLQDTQAFPVPGCPPAVDLTVSKTADPSFTRTFGWTIQKTVDQDHINTAGSATFHYTVTLTKDGGTDSDWAVSGTITVHNPN